MKSRKEFGSHKIQQYHHHHHHHHYNQQEIKQQAYQIHRIPNNKIQIKFKSRVHNHNEP